jgi:hypothetical protein
MDPNAARQSPQQLNIATIIILIRDKKAIDEHNDKNLNVVQRS